MAGILDEFKLDGKIAWVTGASYGLGLAYAEAFAEVGAKIVFNDINQELVDRGLAAYKEKGIDAYGAVCDVTNEEQVNAFVKDVEEKFGTIDILVNNAGIIKRIPMIEMTKGQWDQVINVDLTGRHVTIYSNMHSRRSSFLQSDPRPRLLLSFFCPFFRILSSISSLPALDGLQ